MKKIMLVIAAVLLSLYSAAQANGKLQMHFINVGQGDAALLISPQGQTVLFDEGVANYCEFPVEYLESLGIRSIDYMVTSHYHDDHIGCTKQILDEFPLNQIAYDRGESYPSTVFERYKNAVGTKRRTAVKNERVILDRGTANEVIITFLALNGAGIETDNENDLSLVSMITFGELDIMMGGDLSGYNASNYKDIESKVAKKAKQVEIYKVHHHCSQYSSNTVWINTISPRIGIISVSGEYGRKHGHPSEDCLERLHKAGVETFWTDYGDGSEPDPAWDIVGGNIVVEATPGKNNFTVTCGGSTVKTYPDWGFDGSVDEGPDPVYGWSKNSSIYHYIDCSLLRTVKPDNLQTGAQHPEGKKLHTGCPK